MNKKRSVLGHLVYKIRCTLLPAAMENFLPKLKCNARLFFAISYKFSVVELFTFNITFCPKPRDGKVNETELRMAMTACATGFCRMHGIKPPQDETIHSLAREAFLHQVSSPTQRGFTVQYFLEPYDITTAVLWSVVHVHRSSPVASQHTFIP